MSLLGVEGLLLPRRPRGHQHFVVQALLEFAEQNFQEALLLDCDDDTFESLEGEQFPNLCNVVHR